MTGAPLPQKARHGLSRLLHRYADWRIGATELEKRCYKLTDTILLTFDDYGSQEEVAELLSILHTKQVKAMFFLQGSWAAQHPRLVAQITAAGHIVGNHTWSHANLLSLSDEQASEEIRRGTGRPWLRAPEGRYNDHIRLLARGAGYVMCYWTIDSRDWTGASVATMRHTILSEMHPGAVILFHINGRSTRDLLPGLIDDLRAGGYEPCPPTETWSA